jgi:hypothetical protein
MSDEKRQTRLLPFRLRRAGARRVGAGVRDAEDFGADAGLTALLREWEPPAQTAEARERLLADFRATVRREPLWRRALAAQVRIPVPVAACAALALLLSPLAFGARPWTKSTPPSDATTPAPVVRVVEVPVVQERVVTRIVYVEKKERGGVRGVSSQADGRESLAAETTAAGRNETRKPEDGRPAPSTDASAGAFTRVNMKDFQPADEVKFRILERGSVNEK